MSRKTELEAETKHLQIKTLEAEKARLLERNGRLARQNIVLSRALQGAIERLIKAGGLPSVEVHDFLVNRAEREYEYYLRHGANAENFSDVVADEEEMKEQADHKDVDTIDPVITSKNLSKQFHDWLGQGKSKTIKCYCKKHGIKCAEAKLSKWAKGSRFLRGG